MDRCQVRAEGVPEGRGAAAGYVQRDQEASAGDSQEGTGPPARHRGHGSRTAAPRPRGVHRPPSEGQGVPGGPVRQGTGRSRTARGGDARAPYAGRDGQGIGGPGTAARGRHGGARAAGDHRSADGGQLIHGAKDGAPLNGR